MIRPSRKTATPALRGVRSGAAVLQHIRGRVVHIVAGGIVDRCICPAAEDVDTAAGDGNAEMVACERKRRGHAPAVGCGIVDFVCRDCVALRIASADGVNLSVERDNTRGAPRSAERCEGPPPIGRRVVLEHPVHGADVNVGHEPADDVDLAVQHRGARMRRDRGHERPFPPHAARRVELLVEGVCLDATGAAGNDVDLAVDRGNGDFSALERHGTVRRPAAAL